MRVVDGKSLEHLAQRRLPWISMEHLLSSQLAVSVDEIHDAEVGQLPYQQARNPGQHVVALERVRKRRRHVCQELPIFVSASFRRDVSQDDREETAAADIELGDSGLRRKLFSVLAK